MRPSWDYLLPHRLHHCQPPWVKFTAKSGTTTTIHNLPIHFFYNFFGFKCTDEFILIFLAIIWQFVNDWQGLNVFGKLLLDRTHWHWKTNLMDSIFGFSFSMLSGFLLMLQIRILINPFYALWLLVNHIIKESSPLSVNIKFLWQTQKNENMRLLIQLNLQKKN